MSETKVKVEAEEYSPPSSPSSATCLNCNFIFGPRKSGRRITAVRFEDDNDSVSLLSSVPDEEDGLGFDPQVVPIHRILAAVLGPAVDKYSSVFSERAVGLCIRCAQTIANSQLAALQFMRLSQSTSFLTVILTETATGAGEKCCTVTGTGEKWPPESETDDHDHDDDYRPEDDELQEMEDELSETEAELPPLLPHQPRTRARARRRYLAREVHHKVTCPTCQKSFPSSRQLSLHMRTHLGPDEVLTKYKCATCRVSFLMPSLRDKHMERCQHTLKSQGKGRCRTCGRPTLLSAMDEHEKTHLNASERAERRDVLCDLCGAAFFNKDSLASHNLRMHLNVGKFKCSKCTRTFNSRSALQLHQASHAKGTIRIHNCPYCGEEVRHAAIHAKICKGQAQLALLPYLCFCESRFSGKEYLTQHLLKSHGWSLEDAKAYICPDVPSSFMCSECGTVFESKSSLDHHRRKQHSEGGGTNNYVCSYCALEFTSKAKLHSHSLVCSCPAAIVKRPYVCFCQWRFSAKVYLTQHLMKSHEFSKHDAQKYDKLSTN